MRGRGTVICLLAGAALATAPLACGGDDDDEITSVEALPSSSCSDVEYEGEGEPDVLIASDLPKQGDSAERTAQQQDAIRSVLDREDWQAGGTRVAYQACDDSLEETGEWDEAKCRGNAEAYSDNPDVVGVVGTWNSGCAAEIIPILNEAPEGGVAMVSPGNTLVCLTERSAICEPDEPEVYYPSGTRNYARVVPNDADQGAGLAQLAQRQGIRKPFIVIAAEDPTSTGQAETFRGAAEELGMEIAGFETYGPEAPDYQKLMRKVKSSGADALMIAAILEENGDQLIRDKVEVLGPNDGEVKLLAPDGFAQQATIDAAGEASEGMFASVPGRTPDSLTGRGKALVDELRSELGDDTPVELYAPYAGQAADVLLGAIGAGAERARVIEGVFATRVTEGIVGSFSIDPNGDPTAGPISVLVAGDTFELVEEITPPKRLVDAARGG